MTDRAAYQGAYQAARQRALNRLAKLHHGEYAALLAEERASAASDQARSETANAHPHPNH